MNAIISRWLAGFGCENTIFEFGPETDVARRMYRNHKDLKSFQDWFDNGSNLLCDCDCPRNGGRTYRSGCKVLSFTAPARDIIRDAIGIFLGPLEEGVWGDVHVEIMGSFRYKYRASIDCEANRKSLSLDILNWYSLSSITRNPITREPLIEGGCKFAIRVKVRKREKICMN